MAYKLRFDRLLGIVLIFIREEPATTFRKQEIVDLFLHNKDLRFGDITFAGTPLLTTEDFQLMTEIIYPDFQTYDNGYYRLNTIGQHIRSKL